MQKRVLTIIGVILIFAGIVSILNSFSGITGFTILEDLEKTTSSIIGIVLILGGVILLNSAKTNIHKELSDIADDFNHDKINPLRAAIKLRDSLRKTGTDINGIKYKSSEQTLSIRTPKGKYSVRANNRDKAAELALGIYEIALYNDPKNIGYCELHLGKNASTKHHRKGFQKMEEKFRSDYEEEIKSL